MSGRLASLFTPLFAPSKELVLSEISKIITGTSRNVFDFAIHHSAGEFRFFHVAPAKSMSDRELKSKFELQILKDGDASLATLAASIHLKRFIGRDMNRRLPIRITPTAHDWLYGLEINLSIHDMAETLLENQLRLADIPRESVAIQPSGWSKPAYILEMLHKRTQTHIAAIKDKPLNLQITADDPRYISVRLTTGQDLLDMSLVRWALQQVLGLKIASDEESDSGRLTNNLSILGSPESILRTLQDRQRSIADLEFTSICPS